MFGSSIKLRVFLMVLAICGSASFAQTAQVAPAPGTARVVRDGNVLRPPKDAANDQPLPGKLLNALTPEEQAAGWKLLFDGRQLIGLRGWQKPNPLQAGWKIERGALVLPKEIRSSGKMTGGDLATTTAYDDFELSFEWKISVSGNSGILYFARGGLGQKPAGFEFQLIDDVHHPDGLKGGPLRQTGALYGILPAPKVGEKNLHEPGQWNEGRLVVQGEHVEHWINGAKVLAYDLGPELLQAAQAAKVRLPPGFERKARSPVIFLDQGEEVAFRSLKIRSLAPGTAAIRSGSVPPTPTPPQ